MMMVWCFILLMVDLFVVLYEDGVMLLDYHGSVQWERSFDGVVGGDVRDGEIDVVCGGDVVVLGQAGDEVKRFEMYLCFLGF